MGTYIEVEPNVRLYVEDLGQGHPVVFLHGWPASQRMFETQSVLLPKNGYRYIGIDFRGFGKSDSPWEGYDYDRMADDVKAVVDKLGLSSFTLLGFSMGGAIAVRYMSRHRQHGVERLVLAGAAAPRFTQSESFPYGTPPEKVDEMIDDTYRDRPAMISDFGAKFTLKKPSPSFEAYMSMLCLEATAHGTIRAMESLRDEDLRHDLSNISVKTSIFQGVKDEICPFELAEETKARIHGSTMIRFEESGHAMLYDEPALFNESLLDLLRAGSGAAAAGRVL